MAGLDERDIDVLGTYAKDGNRTLYWNYLARHPGNDGYGLLALGVVRNDNMPGAVANAYAQERVQAVN
ncbi:MAG: hemolysin, partial [Alcaligenaceae bacterium]